MKTKKIAIVSILILLSGSLLYVLFGQEYLYAKSFASELYEYPLPDKTKVIEKDFAYGVLLEADLLEVEGIQQLRHILYLKVS